MGTGNMSKLSCSEALHVLVPMLVAGIALHIGWTLAWL
jgi:hypothetical protein